MKQSKLLIMVAAFMMASSGAFAQGMTAYVINRLDGAPMPPMFVATKNGTTLTNSESIQAVIDDIIADAKANTTGPGINPPFSIGIRFGSGNLLDIGTERASFNNGSGIGSGPSRISLSGKITSGAGQSVVDGPSGTVVIGGSGIIVESEADIANNGIGGNAISIHNGAEVRIIGGTVASTADNHPGYAIHFPLNGGDGSVILSGSPTITGDIQVRAGALSVDPAFAPAEKQYTLLVVSGGVVGSVAVVGGANFIDNFTLANSNLSLAASGSDLVLATTTAVINQKSISAKQSGIVVSGAGLRIVGTSRATPIHIYDMRGKVLMSRQALPNERISVSHLARGTYVVKALGKSIKLVR